MGMLAGMRNALGIVITVLFISSLMEESHSLHIKDLHMPEAVRNGTMIPVILDCEYQLSSYDNPAELVVKWFFNEPITPAPVYQWIQNQLPQGFGVLKGRLNLDYRASTDPYTKYRALKIMNPTPELTGDYSCRVSTFFNESTKTKRFTVYVPEKKLELKTVQYLDEEIVNITCSAEGVFPMPVLTMVLQEKDQELDASTIIDHDNETSLYNISASVVLEDQELPSPSTIYCDLVLPDTNYSARTSATYHPGANAAPKIKIMWILPSFFMFYILF